MGIILLGAMFLLTRETKFMVEQQKERIGKFKLARETADKIGKPLLVIGAPIDRPSADFLPKQIIRYIPLLNNFAMPQYPCGDITLDIDPIVKDQCPNAIVADVKNIPLPDKSCGAVFLSHVLEHLSTIEDFKKALSELHRVADYVFIAYPRKGGIIATCVPDHHLWMWEKPNGWLIEERATGRREFITIKQNINHGYGAF